MIPVTVIGGYLGTGKTTLVNHALRHAGGQRLAILVNEFGALPIDEDLVEATGEDIISIAGGCICCSFGNDLMGALMRLAALDPAPDHILIETSGLALPKPLLKAFDWPDIRSRITVDGVIALADAEAVAAGRFAPNVAAVDAQRAADDSLDHETPLSEVFEDQISCADIILLTKPDLAGPEGVAKAKEIIAAEAPRPLPVVEVAEGAVDPRVILGLGAAAEDDMDARPSHHDGHDDHEHDDFESIVVDLPELSDPAELVSRIEELENTLNILRVKGYAAVAGKPMRLLVQAVGARVRHQYDRPWRADEGRAGRVVVIGEHDDMKEAEIRAILTRQDAPAA